MPAVCLNRTYQPHISALHPNRACQRHISALYASRAGQHCISDPHPNSVSQQYIQTLNPKREVSQQHFLAIRHIRFYRFSKEMLCLSQSFAPHPCGVQSVDISTAVRAIFSWAVKQIITFTAQCNASSLGIHSFFLEGKVWMQRLKSK